MNIKPILAGVTLVAVAACTSASWKREAGSFIDEGGFGNPTMQNMMAQMCSGRSKGYIVPDPIVVPDPNAPASRPAHYRGKVMCSGDLNGKYAEVIFAEYIRSAAPISTLQGGGLREIESQGGTE